MCVCVCLHIEGVLTPSPFWPQAFTHPMERAACGNVRFPLCLGPDMTLPWAMSFYYTPSTERIIGCGTTWHPGSFDTSVNG